MKLKISLAKVVFLLASIATVIGFSAFSQENNGKANSFRKDKNATVNDTSTSGRYFRDEDKQQFYQLDEQMRKLSQQMKHLDEQMKNLDLNLKELDKQGALSKNAQKQMDRALQNIDAERISQDIQKDMAGINRERMAEIRRQVGKVRADIEDQRREMKFDIPRINTERIRRDAERSMEKARRSMEKARGEMGNLRDFTDALQQDGLIDKSKEYKIELKSGELFINGKKQSKEISDKYRQYYRKENFTINNRGGVRV